MTRGILFDGQGSISQLSDYRWLNRHHSAKEKFALLAHSLGFNSIRMLLNVDLKTRTQTWYMQPFIFTFETSMYDIAYPDKVNASVFYGHSLGLYASLYASGTMKFDELLPMVVKRGRCMQETSEINETGLLAVLSYDFELIEYICSIVSMNGKSLYVANRNSYGETVVGGEVSMLNMAHELFHDFGIRSIRLSVCGAFHTPYMDEAKRAFSAYCKESHVPSKPKGHIYLDPAMKPFARLEEILVEQITKPTNFVSVIRKMVDEGVDDFIEIGPRCVLSKYVNEMASGCRTSFLNQEPTLCCV